MTQGWGGWALELRCTLCEATDVFRGVVLTLAADLAIRAGWQVSLESKVLIREPGDRDETCPKCSDALGA